MTTLIVFLGAGLGGALRYGVNLLGLRLIPGGFPGHTMFINIAGSFLMGVVAEYFALRGHLPQQWRLFLATGVLGGFTTFSAFSLDAASLYQRDQFVAAALYVVVSVVGALGALFAGLALARQFS